MMASSVFNSEPLENNNAEAFGGLMCSLAAHKYLAFCDSPSTIETGSEQYSTVVSQVECCDHGHIFNVHSLTGLWLNFVLNHLPCTAGGRQPNCSTADYHRKRGISACTGHTGLMSMPSRGRLSFPLQTADSRFATWLIRNLHKGPTSRDM